MTPEERVQKAIKVLMNYGAVDGAHHKQYALDQTRSIRIKLLASPQNIVGSWQSSATAITTANSTNGM